MMINKYFEEYSSNHKNKFNMVTHYIGIPLIIYGLMIMLSYIPILEFVTVAEILVASVCTFYFYLHWRLALVMLGACSLLLIAAHSTHSIWIGVGLFGIGWVLQLFGHAVFERKSPSFSKNLIHLLIGPLFILNEVLQIRK